MQDNIQLIRFNEKNQKFYFKEKSVVRDRDVEIKQIIQ